VVKKQKNLWMVSIPDYQRIVELLPKDVTIEDFLLQEGHDKNLNMFSLFKI